MEVKPNLANIDIGEVLGIGAALAAPHTLNPDGAPYTAVPTGWKLEDLTKFLPAPMRAKGFVSFGDIESFIRYVNKHKDEAGIASTVHRGTGDIGGAAQPADPDDRQTVVLVDVINSKFRAVFNHCASDAPGWADFGADYNCPLSPEWKTWVGKDGERMSQEQFAIFVEENQLDIVTPEGATMLEIVTTLKSAKNVQFDSGIRLADGRVQLKYHEENTTSAGGAGQLTIPEKIALGIPVYVGGQHYRVEAMFRYRIEGSRLWMWYDLVRPHKILEDALQKLVTQVKEGTSISPYSTTGW